MQRIDALQVVRGMAALCVVLFHAEFTFGPGQLLESQYQLRFLSFGHAGVDIFFVLSGYIILHAHWGDPRSWTYFRQCILKRSTRILPITVVVVVSLVAMIPVLRWLTHDSAFYEISIVEVATSLSLIPLQCNYLPGPLWSLSNEMMFYILFSTYFIKPLIFICCICVVTIMILFNMVYSFVGTLAMCASSPLNLYNSLFIVGVFAFFISSFLRSRVENQWFACAALFIGLSGFVVSAYLDVVHLGAGYFDPSGPSNHYLKLVTHFLYAVSAGFIVMGASMLNWRARGAAGNAFTYLGEASFSLYLVHEPVIGTIARLLQPLIQTGYLNGELAFTLMIAVCIMLGLIFYRFVERVIFKKFRSLLLKITAPC